MTPTYSAHELTRQLVAAGKEPALLRQVADDAATHPAVADICQMVAAVAAAALDLAASVSRQPRSALLDVALGTIATADDPDRR